MSAPRRQINVPGALWRRKWLVVPFVLLGIGGAALAFTKMTRLYRGQATVILIPQTISDTIYSQRRETETRLKDLQLEIASSSFLESLGRAMGVSEAAPAEMRRLTQGFGLAQVDAETFLFHFVDPDPVQAAAQANVIARTFVDESRRKKVQGTEGSAAFLEDEISRLAGELGEAKARLARYQSEHKGELPSDREAHRAEQSFLRTRVAELDGRIEGKRKDILQRQALLGAPAGAGGQVPGAAEVAPDPREVQAGKLRSELADARLRYTDRHPKVIRLQASLDTLLDDLSRNPPPPPGSGPPSVPAVPGEKSEDSLKRFLTLEMTRLQTEINEMEAEKGRFNTRAGQLERQIQASYLRQSDIDQLNAGINLLDTRLLQNQGRLQTLETEKEVFQRGMDERFEVKSAASVPLLPYRPDPLQLLLIGAGAGLLLGAGLALLRELTDRAIRTPEEVEALLEAPVLVTIPDMSHFRWSGEPPVDEKQRRRSSRG